MKNEKLCEVCGDKLITLKQHMNNFLNKKENDIKKRQIEDNLSLKNIESEMEFIEKY